MGTFISCGNGNRPSGVPGREPCGRWLVPRSRGGCRREGELEEQQDGLLFEGCGAPSPSLHRGVPGDRTGGLKPRCCLAGRLVRCKGHSERQGGHGGAEPWKQRLSQQNG